jgi:hypothetical protein
MMRGDTRLPAGSWIWFVVSMAAVFLGSWWIAGDWVSAAVVALVIGTPLLALVLTMSR